MGQPLCRLRLRSRCSRHCFRGGPRRTAWDFADRGWPGRPHTSLRCAGFAPTDKRQNHTGHLRGTPTCSQSARKGEGREAVGRGGGGWAMCRGDQKRDRSERGWGGERDGKASEEESQDEGRRRVRGRGGGGGLGGGRRGDRGVLVRRLIRFKELGERGGSGDKSRD